MQVCKPAAYRELVSEPWCKSRCTHSAIHTRGRPDKYKIRRLLLSGVFINPNRKRKGHENNG
nr:MAG TPA: hypothetical protein [Caudoviricetes sp.]